MHEQDLAIVKALVPVAWADGIFAKREQDMLDALMEAYQATETEKGELRRYAETKRSLDDIELQDLSRDDRRVLLQHAVLLTFVDGDQSAHEVAFLGRLGARLRLEDQEAKELIAAGTERAKKLLSLL